MVNTAYSRIKQTFVLPSPKGAAMEILRLANDDRTTIVDIAAVVEKDPAVASRVLKFVNSPLAGLSRQIASTLEASSLLGLQTLKSIALGFSLVSQHKKGPCRGFPYASFWSDSVARATAARHVAHSLKTTAPDEAFTIGLLSQVGRLAFATAFPDLYAEVLGHLDAPDGTRLTEIERQTFGLDHREFTAEMMRDWHLPDHVCVAVQFQGSTNKELLGTDSPAGQVAHTLHLAGALAALLTQPACKRELLRFTGSEANRLGIRPDILPQIFDSITHEWPAIGSILGVATRHVLSWGELYSHSHSH